MLRAKVAGISSRCNEETERDAWAQYSNYEGKVWVVLLRKDDKELARNYKEKKEDEEELCLVVRADWLQWDTTHTAFEIDGFEKHTS